MRIQNPNDVPGRSGTTADAKAAAEKGGEPPSGDSRRQTRLHGVPQDKVARIIEYDQGKSKNEALSLDAGFAAPVSPTGEVSYNVGVIS